MYKKILSFILAILCIISCGVIGVSAAGNGTPVEEGNFKAVCYSDGTAMLYQASVNEAHVVIPETVGGYVITEISGAFANNKKIESVTIPDTVTGVFGWAFKDCKNLETVNMSDNVKTIGGSAFGGCSSLKSIDIPDSVTKIDSEAFYGCASLTEITIPESVEEIGNSAFRSCTNLETININKNPDLIIGAEAFNNTKWYNSQPDGVVYLDRFALSYKGNMPENLKVDFKEGTTAICGSMFGARESDWETTQLVAVTFPETLTYIGDYTFKNCVNLESINLPESLTFIGINAFENCASLKEVTIPSQVRDLRDSFYKSGVESVTLKGIPDMWYYAFYECENLKEIKLADGIENIHGHAFYGCKALESVTLPHSVKTIEASAFKNCENLKEINHSGEILMVDNNSFLNTSWYNSQPDGLVYFGDVLLGYKSSDSSNIKELIIKEGVRGIAGGAFASNSELKKVVFPESLKVIGLYSFSNTAVENIVIPESVEFIGYGAFTFCSDLTSLEINGNGIIEYNAFLNCLNLKSVTVSAEVEEIGDTALGFYNGMDGKAIVDGFVLKGYENSEAEVYANENGIKFVSLGVATKPSEGKYSLGDVNLDGEVNVRDATTIQKHLASIITLDDPALGVADYDGDTRITVRDATEIQKFIAGIK